MQGTYTPAAFDTWINRYLSPADDSGTWTWDTTPQALPKSAVVLGPITGHLDPDIRAFVSKMSRAASDELRRLGFHVHDPATRPGYGRDDTTITDEDIAAITRANLVVALSKPPAIGIGIGLAASIWTDVPVLILGPDATHITPLTDLIDDLELKAADTPQEVRTAIGDYVLRRGEDLDRHHRQSTQRRADTQPAFERFRAAYQLEQLLIDQGTILPLSPKKKRRMAASLDLFLTTSAWDLNTYMSAIEPFFTQGVDDPTAPLEPNDPQQFERAGFPPPGLSGASIEQSLLDDEVRVIRPDDWIQTPVLNVEHIKAGRKAAARLKLNEKNTDELFTYVSGQRYDELVLAAAGHGRSHRPLHDHEEWITMWPEARKLA